MTGLRLDFDGCLVGDGFEVAAEERLRAVPLLEFVLSETSRFEEEEGGPLERILRGMGGCFLGEFLFFWRVEVRRPLMEEVSGFAESMSAACVDAVAAPSSFSVALATSEDT